MEQEYNDTLAQDWEEETDPCIIQLWEKKSSIPRGEALTPNHPLVVSDQFSVKKVALP